MYLNGGPFPTAEGQISIMAGSGLGGGTVVNWTNCLRTHEWVREEWAREHGLEGLDGSDYDAHLDAVLERLQVNDACSDLNGVARAPAGGMREARLRLPARSPATPIPSGYDPETPAYMGFGDVSGSKQSTTKTYLQDAARSRREISSPTAAPSGSWSRTVAPPASRRRGPTRTRSGEPARRASGRSAHPPSSSPAGRSSRRRCCCARGSAGPPSATTCACTRPRRSAASTTATRTGPGARRRRRSSHEFADSEDGYGFLLECSQSTTGLFAGRDALDLRPRAQAAHARLDADRGLHQPHPRPRARAGRRSTTHGERRGALPAQRRARRAQLPPRPRRDDQAPRRRRRAARSSRWPAAREPGSAARTSTASSPRSAPARWRRASTRSSPPTRWAAAGWAAIRRRASPTRAASCTTRRASGSATRAPSRRPRGRTR